MSGETGPVFVSGCERSGTTLLRLVLDRHPQLSISGESFFYPRLAGHFHKRLGPAAMWELFIQDKKGAAFASLREAALERLGSGANWIDLFGAILDADAASQGKRIAGEKSPGHLAFVPQILKDFPGAKAVIIVRDGRDVIRSLKAMPWNDSDPVRAWMKAAVMAKRFTRAWPQRVILVRYEDLVTEPQATLGAVMGFLGLEPHPGQLQSGARSFVNDSQPWHAMANKELDPSRAYGWKRSELSEAALAENAVLRPLLVSLGYEAGPRASTGQELSASLTRLRLWQRWLPLPLWRAAIELGRQAAKLRPRT